MSKKKRPQKQAEKREKKPPKHPEAALYKQLRQRQQDALEFLLRNHFEAEAPDSGFSSSFGALTDMALAGPGGGSARDPDARLARDERMRRIRGHRAIHAALAAIPDHARVLRAAYGDERLPGEVYGPDFYGAYPGVALLTPTAQCEFAAEVSRREAALREADTAAMLDRMAPEVREKQRARDEQREAELHCVLDEIAESEDVLNAPVDAGVTHAEREQHQARLLPLRRREAEIRANLARFLPTLEPAVLAKQAAVQKLKGATIGEWLRSGRSKDHRPAIRQEADALLRGARAAFQAAHEQAREELGRRGGWEKRERVEAAEVKRARGRSRLHAIGESGGLVATLPSEVATWA